MQRKEEREEKGRWTRSPATDALPSLPVPVTDAVWRRPGCRREEAQNATHKRACHSMTSAVLSPNCLALDSAAGPAPLPPGSSSTCVRCRASDPSPRVQPEAVPYGGHICRNQYQIGFRIRRNPPYGAKNTDDYGFQICSLPVFDRSAEQIGANPPVYGFAPISLAPAFCYLLLIVFVFK